MITQELLLIQNNKVRRLMVASGGPSPSYTITTFFILNGGSDVVEDMRLLMLQNISLALV